MAIEALEQTVLLVDDIEYLVTAMGATQSLDFMKEYQAEIDSGKDNLLMRKQVICSSVQKDNKVIDPKRFDIVFSRKYRHLAKLYTQVIEWNFPDFFEKPGTEE